MMSYQPQSKQERRKAFADVAIQGTNNSSIASKRSVELLYHPKMDFNKDVNNGQSLEYFKWFVPKASKRSPCINRGYWLRLYAIRSHLDHIAETTQGPVVVMNLGCGFDPLPFQLLDERNGSSKPYWKRFSFVDVDYPELIEEKLNVIEQSEELRTIVGPPKGTGKFEMYSLVPCNLNFPDSFEQLVQSLGACTTVFIAEVSLAYMSPKHADKIISLCSAASPSHFLLLEQLTPASSEEPFAHQMLKHFAKNRSPLLSVIDYPTVESQKERFKQLGFPYIDARDMFQLWCSLDEGTRKMLQEMELFDELEEFHLFAHHYLILHAATEPFELNSFPQYTGLQKTDITDVSIEYLNMDTYRKFGASVFDSNRGSVLYFGGATPNRVNETMSIDANGACELLLCENNPPSRVSHTFTFTDIDVAVVIGGRKNPVQGLSDTWFLDLRSQKWKRGPSLPEPRYRHASCQVDRGQVLVLGGKTTGAPALLLNAFLNSIQIVSAEIPLLISPAVDYNLVSQVGVLIGGSLDETNFSDCLYLFTYENNNIKIINKIRNSVFCRYGSQVKFITDSELILVGGTGPTLFGAANSIILININSGKIRGIRLPHPLPMLVGTSLEWEPSSRQLFVIGGGATCYGFGSVWNRGLTIRIERD
ncbi:PPM2 (YOL141W) [Zygosaccharomyces parabailii]|nr:PPM2 (YOL141W) [Zygosaccharomyces parabailii]